MSFKISKATSKVIRKLVLDINADLIGETPVDFGWARSNWVPSVGTPFSGPAGTPENLDAGPQSAGTAEIVTQYSIDDGPAWITNNVPYINRLNAGSSRQAPRGFVDKAVERNVRAISRRRLP